MKVGEFVGMDFRRVTLVCGHYGSGKTSIAVNLAAALGKAGEKTVLADLDIVNPYFRSVDHASYLHSCGVRIIASRYASSALDLPALPQELYSITEDRTTRAVLDIGGDDRGALALGRWRDALKRENNYEMWFVVNRYRPLTRTGKDAVAIMREIETAAGMKCTHIVNNSNLGPETTPEDIISSAPYAAEICKLSGLPLKMTCASAPITSQLTNSAEELFPLEHLTQTV